MHLRVTTRGLGKRGEKGGRNAGVGVGNARKTGGSHPPPLPPAPLV